MKATWGQNPENAFGIPKKKKKKEKKKTREQKIKTMTT